ncbi:hypothetical protein EC1_16720 [Faecalitalea cylindroides T2-87]|uniref:Uncharacterized protein n=1 Tax=Faecalitalea cylindroides T2-87 TaxID=717960 RepID=D4JFK3_9FIRM|nr:hypothetical protein EC1_16720 [Faecalitalea cylindroides T2-87]
MEKKKFAYDVEIGTIMDYVEDHFMLVIKDETWSDEEIELIKKGATLNLCYTQDLAIFVLEGGDIDSSDFYFNIQDCDLKDEILEKELLDVELILVDGKNNVWYSKRKTLSLEQSKIILDCLKKQAQVGFMPGEYEVNIAGIQSAYEPFELENFRKYQ